MTFVSTPTERQHPVAGILPAWAQEGGAAGRSALSSSAQRGAGSRGRSRTACRGGRTLSGARAGPDRDRERRRPQRGGGRIRRSRMLAAIARRPGGRRARTSCSVRARRDYYPPLRLRHAVPQRSRSTASSWSARTGSSGRVRTRGCTEPRHASWAVCAPGRLIGVEEAVARLTARAARPGRPPGSRPDRAGQAGRPGAARPGPLRRHGHLRRSLPCCRTCRRRLGRWRSRVEGRRARQGCGVAASCAGLAVSGREEAPALAEQASVSAAARPSRTASATPGRGSRPSSSGRLQ